MNAVTQLDQPRGVIAAMADRFGMAPAAFEATIRATCMPRDANKPEATREEFAAFLLVAKEYGLNPLTREIYAYPRKGGGIVPVVSVDGWVNLINNQGQLDGIEFDINNSVTGDLESITCRIWRKDRSKPVTVTEYLSECIRGTDPWKMKHRMLRHKALIQCARYAFGFSGIHDEDEARDIAMKDVTPASTLPQEPPREPPRPQVAQMPPRPPQTVSEAFDEVKAVMEGEPMTPEELKGEIEEHLSTAQTLKDVQEIRDLFEEDIKAVDHEVALVRAIDDMFISAQARITGPVNALSDKTPAQPFQVPDRFDSITTYELWLSLAIESSVDREPRPARLRTAWKATIPHRAALKVPKEKSDEWRALVETKLSAMEEQ